MDKMFVRPFQQSFELFQHSIHTPVGFTGIATGLIVVSFTVGSWAVCYSWDSCDSAYPHVTDPTHTH